MRNDVGGVFPTPIDEIKYKPRGGGIPPATQAWTITHCDLLWVCQAASDDDGRYFMNGLHVEEIEGGCLHVCTDGKRIHVWRSLQEIMEPGEYLIVKRTLSRCTVVAPHDVRFAEWRRVMPRYKKPRKVVAISDGDNRHIRKMMQDVSWFLCALGNATKGKIALSVPLVNGIFNHQYVRRWNVYFQPGTHQAVGFVSEDKNHRAVVMPIIPK